MDNHKLAIWSNAAYLLPAMALLLLTWRLDAPSEWNLFVACSLVGLAVGSFLWHKFANQPGRMADRMGMFWSMGAVCFAFLGVPLSVGAGLVPLLLVFAYWIPSVPALLAMASVLTATMLVVGMWAAWIPAFGVFLLGLYFRQREGGGDENETHWAWHLATAFLFLYLSLLINAQ